MSSDIENYGSVIEDSLGLKMSLGFYLSFWIVGSFILGFYSYNQMFFL